MDGHTVEEPEPDVLVRRAENNDPAAWHILVQRYGPPVWNIARGMGLAPRDAADVQQTVWLRLVEHLPRLRDPSRVGAWLLTTTRNECLRQIAVNHRSRLTDTGELDQPDHHHPERRVTEHDQLRTLLQLLTQLPHPCALLLRLSALTPALEAAELAAATGIPPHRIGPRRRRCLRQLRNRLDGAVTPH